MRTNQAHRDAVIVEAVRTPIGRGSTEKGYYGSLHPADLLGRCYEELLRRTGCPSAAVDNVIAGCVYQIAEQSAGIARTAWLAKGFAETTGATTVDVRCGSGQQAVNFAALRIEAGVDDIVVAAGIEHMGRVGFTVHEAAQERWGRALLPELLGRHDIVPQGLAAEMIAERWGIPRAEQDELALTVSSPGPRSDRSGPFRARDLPRGGRWDGVSNRPGDPPRDLDVGAGRSGAGLQAERARNRRQLLANLRRRCRPVADDRRAGSRAWPATPSTCPRPGRRWR